MTSSDTKRLNIFKNALAKIGAMFFYAACLFTATGFLGKFGLLFELTSHFRVQYFVILFVALLLYFLQKKYKYGFLAIILCLVNFSVILPWYISVDVGDTDSHRTSLKLMLVNVYSRNTNYTSLLDIINNESPDIIVLEEVTGKWLQAIYSLKNTYPYQKAIPRNDNFGIAILSRIPLDELVIKDFGKVGVPSIMAKVNVNKSELLLIGTHPVPPVTSVYFKRRNEQIADIANTIKEHNNRSIVLGDFNLTMWSYYHNKFLKDTGLKNARKGFGIKPTWHGVFHPMTIPIDHCFVSQDIIIKNFSTAVLKGSDHRVVLLELDI